MNAFKLRRFHALVILQCVRGYCKYAISYRQLEEMMAERGIAVDHTTIWRWIQRYAPQLEKEVRWYQGGFKSMKTAYATIKGFEVMRMFKKGQFAPWIDATSGGTEARFINRLFGLYA